MNTRAEQLELFPGEFPRFVNYGEVTTVDFPADTDGAVYLVGAEIVAVRKNVKWPILWEHMSWPNSNSVSVGPRLRQ